MLTPEPKSTIRTIKRLRTLPNMACVLEGCALSLQHTRPRVPARSRVGRRNGRLAGHRDVDWPLTWHPTPIRPRFLSQPRGISCMPGDITTEAFSWSTEKIFMMPD